MPQPAKLSKRPENFEAVVVLIVMVVMVVVIMIIVMVMMMMMMVVIIIIVVMMFLVLHLHAFPRRIQLAAGRLSASCAGARVFCELILN